MNWIVMRGWWWRCGGRCDCWQLLAVKLLISNWFSLTILSQSPSEAAVSARPELLSGGDWRQQWSQQRPVTMARCRHRTQTDTVRLQNCRLVPALEWDDSGGDGDGDDTTQRDTERDYIKHWDATANNAQDDASCNFMNHFSNWVTGHETH